MSSHGTRRRRSFCPCTAHAPISRVEDKQYPGPVYAAGPMARFKAASGSVLALALVIAGAPRMASADTSATDKATAEALFNEAKRLMDAGDYGHACARFADSQKLESGGSATDIQAFERGVLVLRELSQILGMFEHAPAKAESASDALLDGLMQLLIELRADARKAKNFAQADLIRKRLTELGVTLEDRAGGTGWRRNGGG